MYLIKTQDNDRVNPKMKIAPERCIPLINCLLFGAQFISPNRIPLNFEHTRAT